MPRRQRDPAAAILAYFETAELGIAKTIHALADEALRRRLAKQTTPKPAISHKKKLPGPVATVGE